MQIPFTNVNKELRFYIDMNKFIMSLKCYWLKRLIKGKENPMVRYF